MKSLQPGERVGPYEIVGALATRGLGEVYRARDTRGGAEVSLKILAGASPMHVPALGAHPAPGPYAPGIVTVFDVGAHDGLPYVAFELLEGETLAARLGRGPLPAGQALQCVLQVARSLAVAHDRGLVHTRLCVDNLFLGADGRARVLDGALAAGYGSNGALPPDAGQDVKAWARLAEAVLGPAAPAPIREIVSECLHADARRRPATGRELVARLEQVMERNARQERAAGRLPWPALLAASAALAAGAVTAWLL